MKPNEAISLLISGITDSRNLLEESLTLLDELAQDVHYFMVIDSISYQGTITSLCGKHKNFFS